MLDRTPSSVLHSRVNIEMTIFPPMPTKAHSQSTRINYDNDRLFDIARKWTADITVEKYEDTDQFQKKNHLYLVLSQLILLQRTGSLFILIMRPQ